jgi:hypothetical protein
VPTRPRTSDGATLSPAVAGKLAEILLEAIGKAYPNLIILELHGDDDLVLPRVRTPSFCGAFDWHSSVHGHFSLARLLRSFPDAPWAERAREALARAMMPEHVAREAEHLRRRPRFEVPYGVAWLLALAGELERGGAPMSSWREAIRPLEERAEENLFFWLRRLSHPIRTGEHNQTAFAMTLALAWAHATRRTDAFDLLRRIARRLYLQDVSAPLAYEPSAHDFLSPALSEADLMSRVLSTDEFDAWLSGFLPQLEDPELGVRFSPVRTIDRSDGKLVHFDGLNLSRAWMLRRLASALPEGDPRMLRLTTLAAVHGRAGLAGVSDDHFAGSHWLGTFALLWLTSRDDQAHRRT